MHVVQGRTEVCSRANASHSTKPLRRSELTCANLERGQPTVSPEDGPEG